MCKLKKKQHIARISTSLTDNAWDEFLTSTPLGEFQQASFWAAYKAADGWQCHRTTVTNNGQVIGGFQLLWRKTRFGPIGYVSKGPVITDHAYELFLFVVDLLVKSARQLHLKAIIVQPPGTENCATSQLPQNLFAPNYLMAIVSSTLRIDVSKEITEIEMQMRRTTRQQIRKARRAGVQVRTGEEKDIGTFFSLMLESCKRQKSAPNPSSHGAFLKLWKVSHAAGAGCRLTFAEHKGRTVAGLFCIPFGNILTLWKKGALPEFFHLHAMESLYHEAFAWAHSNGFHYCDFGALNRPIAEALSNGLPVPASYQRSLDIFNLGFGGYPVLLSKSFIHFPNKLFRQTYTFFLKGSRARWQIQKASSRLFERKNTMNYTSESS